VQLVSDRAIQDAQEALWKVLRIVSEPGGAAAFAALLTRGYQPRPGERVGVLVCGANTTAVNFGSGATDQHSGPATQILNKTATKSS
jgi:threonine dehydratase